MTHQGRRGVAFAVWAPSANQVSVVGNFNGWKGANHPMRRLGNSGVWELFIPGLKAGELYKYEIKHGRRKVLKADPYAFMMEMPPDTSSIVFKSTYKFSDRAWMTKRKKHQTWREPLAIDYRGWRVHCSPPPSSGFQYLECLKILAPTELRALAQFTKSALTTRLRLATARLMTFVS